MRVIGISGSLRAASLNTLLLRAAAEMVPSGVTFAVHSIDDLPLYNADLDRDGDRPASVQRLKESIVTADALLFATPEFNYSVPGGLKNAIDWASRPAYKSCLALKPAGILTVSTAVAGGARAQGHLKVILSGCLTPVYPAPEYLLGSAGEKFDPQGRLSDTLANERLRRYIEGFIEWVERQAHARAGIT